MPDSTDISVVIANYNNGPESSLFGHDIIGDCLRAIRDTVGDVSWECLIWDDGSTDSGLDTVRKLATEDPRFRLFEGEHIGRIGETYNRMMSKARGEICCRMDGDTLTITAGWGPRVLEHFRGREELGFVGPVQTWDTEDPNPEQAGRVRCFRCWLWTPKGRRNPWRGMEVSRCDGASGDCDYVSGSWVAFPRKMWVAGVHWDAAYLGRGEDLDWFVRGRALGWRCYGDAAIHCVHRDTVRTKRGARDIKSETYDAQRFSQVWNFHHYHPEAKAVEIFGDSWRAAEKDIPQDAKF